MIQEVWMPVQGYNGLYEVSSIGRVRGITRIISLQTGKTRTVKGKILTPKSSTDGYLFVSLSKKGVAKTKYIHRLVAEAHIGNPGHLPEVNHLSGDKTDNTVGNLEWCTHSENMRHAYDTGLCSQVGSNHHWAVGIIDNELGREFGSIKEWTEARGINYATGRNKLKGKQTEKNGKKVIELNGLTQKLNTNDNANC